MATHSCLVNPHGQRSLAGYSPWGHKESDMTEQLSTHTHTRVKLPRFEFTLLFTLCGTLDKLLDLSGSLFLHLEMQVRVSTS